MGGSGVSVPSKVTYAIECHIARNFPSGQTCPICLSEIQHGATGALACVNLSSCSHFFHRKCLVEWVKVHPSCPSCRAPSILENKDDMLRRWGVKVVGIGSGEKTSSLINV